jgi:cellulose synthase/poly-beta-1,6-N-acetylglucosamine synthase-like glycosyltransferase
MDESALSISVIVPAYNAKTDDLVDLFRSLSSLDYPADLFEIILVDDGSKEDHMLEALNKVDNKARIGVQIVRSKRNYGVSAARNMGAQFSRGDILAFADSDCVVEVSWLRNIADLFTRFIEISAASGPCLPSQSNRLIGKCEMHIIEASFEKKVWADGYKKSGTVARGGNFAIRREVFFSLGGFNESLRTKEDHEFAQRIINSGGKIYFSNSILVYHKYREKLKDILLQSFYHANGDGMIAFKYPNLVDKESLFILAGALGYVAVLVFLLISVPQFTITLGLTVFASSILLYFPYFWLSKRRLLKCASLRETLVLPILSLAHTLGWSLGFLVGVVKALATGTK